MATKRRNQATYFVIKHKAELIAHHGNACVNCGSEEGIEWHHIVPIEDGGNDTIGNIVPLCANCHGLLTYGNMTRKVRRYEAAKRGGRPRAQIDDALMWLYALGMISYKEFKEKSGVGGGTKPIDSACYKDFLKNNEDGIKFWKSILERPFFETATTVQILEAQLQSVLAELESE